MKIILPCLALFLFSNFSNAQTNAVDNFIADTATYTVIESTLRQTGVPQKVEYLHKAYIGGVNMGIIVIHNLKTQAVTKGVYFSNGMVGGYNLFTPQRGSRAYVDESELDGLVEFFDNCNNTWKNDSPQNSTSYEFETKDKFRIRFASDYSDAWRFSMQFRSYYFFNLDRMSKNKSDQLYNTIKLFRDSLKTY